MGRMRIKKKDAVIPFRQTVAYRFILVGAALLVFLIAGFQVVRAILTANLTDLALSGAIAAGAGVLLAYNLNRMQQAKVPRRTLERMKIKRGR